MAEGGRQIGEEQGARKSAPSEAFELKKEAEEGGGGEARASAGAGGAWGAPLGGGLERGAPERGARLRALCVSCAFSPRSSWAFRWRSLARSAGEKARSRDRSPSPPEAGGEEPWAASTPEARAPAGARERGTSTAASACEARAEKDDFSTRGDGENAALSPRGDGEKAAPSPLPCAPERGRGAWARPVASSSPERRGGGPSRMSESVTGRERAESQPRASPRPAPCAHEGVGGESCPPTRSRGGALEPPSPPSSSSRESRPESALESPSSSGERREEPDAASGEGEASGEGTPGETPESMPPDGAPGGVSIHAPMASASARVSGRPGSRSRPSSADSVDARRDTTAGGGDEESEAKAATGERPAGMGSGEPSGERRPDERDGEALRREDERSA